MEVKLIVVTGRYSGQEILVSGPKFFIGRAEDCQLRPGSDLVSRHHAVILVEEGFVAIRDFSSKNGTFVNDDRIKSEQELKSGDRIRIGPLQFEVQLAVQLGGKKKPKVHSVQEAAARTVQSAADDDLDLSDWLDDDQQSPATTQIHAAQPMETTPTAGNDIKDTIVIRQDDPQQEPKEKKKGKKETTVGRLPQSKRPAAVDSRAAADDMLRQFFGRKT